MFASLGVSVFLRRTDGYFHFSIGQNVFPVCTVSIPLASPYRENLAKLLHVPLGRALWGRPRARWRDYISKLAWECLRIPQEEVANIARERDVWSSQLDLLPP